MKGVCSIMDNNKEEIKYVYPVEELDKLIEEMESGVMPMISDGMMNEVKLRRAELLANMGTPDYSDIDTVDTKAIIDRHKALLKKQLDNEKHKATKNDVLIIDITDEQKAKIKDDMCESIVRSDPTSAYNRTDEELYEDETRREIELKLKGLRNCYYNQIDYQNAMKIIMDAIQESLGRSGHGDYPELSYKEAVKEFEAGRIKFVFRTIPKLYSNHSTYISDTSILAGVVKGDVELKDRKESLRDSYQKHLLDKRVAKPVVMPYTVTSKADYDRWSELHRRGYDTPISTAIRYKSTTYNPAAMPLSSRFGFIGRSDVDRSLDEYGNPILFDWSKEGAGKQYFNMIHGRKTSISDIMRFVNEQNGGRIGSFIEQNARDFLNSMKNVGGTVSPSYNYMIPNFEQPTTNKQYNVEAAKMEEQLLASITMNSPSTSY